MSHTHLAQIAPSPLLRFLEIWRRRKKKEEAYKGKREKDRKK
jgi:hypothetical protein